MLDGDDPIQWDFLTLVDAWNLYGLPVLLVVVAIAVLFRARHRPAAAWHDGSRTVLLVGLIHCVLSLQAFLSLGQELLTLRVMGIPQSFVSPVTAVISSVVNPILALGLLRRRPWARRLAIGWYAFRSVLAVLVVVWLYYYRVRIELSDWPEQVISKILPVFLFVVMLLPRIKRVFARQAPQEPKKSPAESDAGASSLAEAPAGWPLLTLLFLTVACSNLVVSAADWALRLMFESESLP